MPTSVRGGQPLGHLPGDAADLADAHEALADHLLERAPLHVLEDEVVLVVARSSVDEGDEIGVGELSERPPLAVEPGPGARILVQRGLQPLHGHVALQPSVPGLVDDAHATATQYPAQPVSVL